MKVSIIGGGAAGFFAAINLKRLSPECDVTIYESSSALLSKVLVSGGGRCNLTNTFKGYKGFSKIYPRGAKVIGKVFKLFNHEDAYKWFEDNGVALTTQEDQCVFPKSQNSREIVGTFLRLADELGIAIERSHRVLDIEKIDDKFHISTDNRNNPEIVSDYVIVTTGGSPQVAKLLFLHNLPVEIESPVPSLFSLKIPCNDITNLTGAVIDNVLVRLKGTNVRTEGTMLITHWGVSGPAILKLSSHAARRLYDREYKGEILINWVGSLSEEEIVNQIIALSEKESKKLVVSASPFGFSSRVWEHILNRSDISTERRWAELKRKGINRIVATLVGDEYTIDGRGANKEEFVTCGGVSRHSINPATMELRLCKGLFLAGEVLDVDGITGGFNLQAAWSTAYSAAYYLSESIKNRNNNIINL